MRFFFFQAEDGIRDIGVTGVQTCALPIYEDVLSQPGLRAVVLLEGINDIGGGGATAAEVTAGMAEIADRVHAAGIPVIGATDRKSVVEGKSVDLGGRRIIKKKKNKKPRTSTGS